MKVIKKEKEFRTVTLKISQEVMRQLDTISDANNVSRQKLIESILKQVLSDKHFELLVDS